MIQANELRLGNIVRLSSTTSEVEFEIIDGLSNNLASEPIRCIHLAGNGIWNFEAQINPIPLSKEVLLACGFKQQVDNKNLFFLNDFRYSLNEKYIMLLRKCDKAGESQKHSCGFPFFTDCIRITYLHELQNLIYALCKTELNYQS